MPERRARTNPSNLVSAGLAVLLTLGMAGCSMLPKKAPPPTPAPAVTEAAPSLQHVIDLLQLGKAQAADAELHALLKVSPESRSGKYLLAQIETPIASLYPSESFTVRLTREEGLSSLARIYLGNSLGFYGLARYNNIPVPGKVAHGQAIRIPKTAEALAVLASHAAKAQAPAAPTVVPASLSPSQQTPTASDATKEAQHRKAEDWYRRGLVAFQRQDLDGAIAAWDKALAIEPDNKEAALNRAQAVRLKANLSKLKKASQSH
ncbi:MAG: tetratricopeptide repeat protein [Alphaproteobacteria bacterium]|nr:tetratricopeptide repeat protein [Alphaproteobacteria bacterium]